jgi:hypothetical protein
MWKNAFRMCLELKPNWWFSVIGTKNPRPIVASTSLMSPNPWFYLTALGKVNSQSIQQHVDCLHKFSICAKSRIWWSNIVEDPRLIFVFHTRMSAINISWPNLRFQINALLAHNCTIPDPKLKEFPRIREMGSKDSSSNLIKSHRCSIWAKTKKICVQIRSPLLWKGTHLAE